MYTLGFKELCLIMVANRTLTRTGWGSRLTVCKLLPSSRARPGKRSINRISLENLWNSAFLSQTNSTLHFPAAVAAAAVAPAVVVAGSGRVFLQSS